MDKNIKDLQNISQIDVDDVLIIQKKNGDIFNIDLSQLIQFVMDNSPAGISEYKFTNEGRAFIQEVCNTSVLAYIKTAPTSCEEILPYCANKATLESIITLGGVSRTVLFAYDSYIYFYEYSSKLPANNPNYCKPDYYNYTAQFVLNNIIYYCRIQFYLDGVWTAACYKGSGT